MLKKKQYCRTKQQITIDILSQRNLTDVSFVRQCNFPTHAQKRQILVQGSLTYYLGKKSTLVGGLRDTKRIWGGEGGLWVALEIPNGYGCFLRRGWKNLKLKWVSGSKYLCLLIVTMMEEVFQCLNLNRVNSK